MTTTIIQKDLTIEGNLAAKGGTISIGGNVTGDIDAKSVEILSGGKVAGGISAETVKISGALDGSVKCGVLDLDSNSELKADLSADTMTMGAGAKISGRVEVGKS